MKHEVANFADEAELCSTFIRWVPDTWIAYPETGGFDILLVRREDGAQIGIEAKMVLNTKVISQILPHDSHWSLDYHNPDFRAVLVPWGRSGGLTGVCRRLNITVIRMASKALYQSWSHYHKKKFDPELPLVTNSRGSFLDERDWVDWCPAKRVIVPDYVPDVSAGRSAPVQLSIWKIKAIKLVIILERRGYVTRADFKQLHLDPGRWIYSGRWLDHGTVRGQWVATQYTPDFRKQHPVNFAQIEADYEHWSLK